MLVTLLIIGFGIPSGSAIERHYFIAAEDVYWNYAPTGRNLVTEDKKASSEKIKNGPDRIGSIYKKAIYRGYTDNTFTQRVHVPDWAGLLGPLIKAEVEDVVFIHFRNMATGSSFSVHPYGFQYDKSNEGAVYIDGTSGSEKLDDAVLPGGNITYTWHASRMHEPTAQDDNCYAFAYHSHTLARKDVDTGLVGLGLICRKGTLDSQGNRIDVDKEFYLYADVADENNNWYADEHIRSCGNITVCQSLKEARNNDFMESNKMSHINGFVYGNLPDFTTCEGKHIVWYFMSINKGIHTMHVNGQTMIIEQKRTDTAVLFPGSVYSGSMTPINPGRWLIYSRNHNHYDEGMQAFLNVRQCPKQSQLNLTEPVTATRPGYTRRYFIAVEEDFWDYAPGVMISTLNGASTFLERGPQRIGRIYKKAMFVEYADPSFTLKKETGFLERHYGLSGPLIGVEEGENLVVVIMNKASREYSFLANGVGMTKDNEGAYYKNIKMDPLMAGAIVSPGSSRTYEFNVPNEAKLTQHNTDCVTYVYQSAVDFTRDIYTGLFGPLLVCKSGTLAPDRRQIDVDRQIFLNWMVIDENKSWYIDENIAIFTGNLATVDKSDPNFRLSNKMRAINGRSFGTLDGLRLCTNENITWHMYGLGGQIDHHHFSFEGNNFKLDTHNLDTASVFPGVGRTVTMTPDQTGNHLLRDSQLGFEAEGMYAWYDIWTCTGRGPRNTPSVVMTMYHPRELLSPAANIAKSIMPKARGIVRHYYIAAVEQYWDYAPIKTDPRDGSSLLHPDNKGYIYVRNDPPFHGTVYYKALYREFTNGSFTIMKQRTPDELHLGILGPVIKGCVGDTIKIVFKNFATFPYNIIPRNVVFEDGSSVSSAPPTLPGEIREYTYVIPERSGPTSNESNCVGSFYVSRVTPMNDTYSGLAGPFVVCKEGVLDSLGRRSDGVTKEFATGFIIFDENKSNYMHRNFANSPFQSITNPDLTTESNKMHSINGLIYGNLKGLVFNETEHSVWYVFGLGSVKGIHTIHYHGQLYSRQTSLSLKRNLLPVFPGTYKTVEMIGYNPGTWLLHCNVRETEGMVTTYTILPRLGSDKVGHGQQKTELIAQNSGGGPQSQERKQEPIPHQSGIVKLKTDQGKVKDVQLSDNGTISSDSSIMSVIDVLLSILEQRLPYQEHPPGAPRITQQPNNSNQRAIASSKPVDTPIKRQTTSHKERQKTNWRDSSKDDFLHKKSWFVQ